jgi:hypothetical protein
MFDSSRVLLFLLIDIDFLLRGRCIKKRTKSDCILEWRNPCVAGLIHIHYKNISYTLCNNFI